MSWVVALARGGVAGLAVGLVAAALQLARRRTGRLDLVPALAGAAVALVAARVGGGEQLERVVDGVLLVPLAGLAGALVQLVVADRPRRGSEATRAVLVPVACFVAGSAALGRWADDRTALEAARTSGLRFSDRLVLSWVELAAAAAAVAAVALLGLAVGRGRTGLRLRAAGEAPELLPLVGVEPGRLDTRLAGLGAAAGALGGLFLGATGQAAAPAAPDLALRAGESVLIGGAPSLVAALAGGVVLELSRVVGGQLAEGWGPATGHAVTLGVVGLRWIRSARTRTEAEPAAEEYAT